MLLVLILTALQLLANSWKMVWCCSELLAHLLWLEVLLLAPAFVGCVDTHWMEPEWIALEYGAYDIVPKHLRA